MAKSDFVPKPDNDFLAWLDPLAVNAEAHQAGLSLSDAAVAKLKASAVDFRAKLAANTQAQAAARHASEEKSASRPTASPPPAASPGRPRPATATPMPSARCCKSQARKTAPTTPA